MAGIPGGKKEEVEKYMKEKLRLDDTFVREELGEVTLQKPKELRNRNKEISLLTLKRSIQTLKETLNLMMRTAVCSWILGLRRAEIGSESNLNVRWRRLREGGGTVATT